MNLVWKQNFSSFPLLIFAIFDDFSWLKMLKRLRNFEKWSNSVADILGKSKKFLVQIVFRSIYIFSDLVIPENNILYLLKFQLVQFKKRIKNFRDVWQIWMLVEKLEIPWKMLLFHLNMCWKDAEVRLTGFVMLR